MPTYLAPDVYVEEVSKGTRPIEAVGTSTAGFVGVAPDKKARKNEVVAINNWTQFEREFAEGATEGTHLSNAVFGFFQNGGSRCYVVNIGDNKRLRGSGRGRQGIDLLEEQDEVAIVAAPGFTDASSYEAVLAHCENMGDRVAVLDTPNVSDIEQLKKAATESGSGESSEGGNGGVRPRDSEYGATYFPWIYVRDPLAPGQTVAMPPSGHVAGVWARTDATRGVHKAPANERITGALGVSYQLTRAELGELNTTGVNCIRQFPRAGVKIWGARTLAPSASEWRYLNVRRMFNMIGESIAENTRWTVFEPNDSTLWKSIRRDISAFLALLWRDGMLLGRSPGEAFFVKCDEETNPQEVIDAGMVVTLIGIAPVKPAEFIVFRIFQHQSGADVQSEGGE